MGSDLGWFHLGYFDSLIGLLGYHMHFDLIILSTKNELREDNAIPS